MLVIPRAPGRLSLPLDRCWDGRPSSQVRGRAELQLAGGELLFRAELRQPRPPRTPAAPPGQRFEGLWEYDVVECFLAGAGGRYLELEVDAAAHFLALSFRARRVRETSWPGLHLRSERGHTPDGAWWSLLRVPVALLPRGLRAANAFAIAAGELLACHPLPGPVADFHQPERWPAARLAAP